MDGPHECMSRVDDGSLVAETFRAYKRSMMAHRRLMTAAFAEQEIHHAQAGCLRIITARDGLSQADLADALHVSRPTVTATLQKMEAAGMIERRDDAHDSRITRVYATAEGARIAERLESLYTELTESTFGAFTDAELAQFKRLLELLAERQQQTTDRLGGGATAPMHPDHHGVEEAR